MDPYASPFLLRLNALHDSIVPPTLFRAIACLDIACATPRGGSLRHQPAEWVLARLCSVRSDAALRRHIIEKATLHEVRTIWLAGHRVCRVAFHPMDETQYEWIRQKLGKRPTALRMVRLGLRSFEWT